MGIGSSIGSLLGDVGSSILPIPGINGKDFGGFLGSLLGFKHGGAVKRTGKALVHKGEYVLPVGVRPTKAQRSAVAKRKRDAKK